ncbi:hypothetical protein ACSTH7_25055, partial [Vibrio parahaemolyticus]
MKEPIPRTASALRLGAGRVPGMSLAPTAGATAMPRATSAPAAIPDIQRAENTQSPLSAPYWYRHVSLRLSRFNSAPPLS